MDEFYLAPPTYEKAIRQYYKIKYQYPEVRLFPIGKSLLGRRIYAFSLGNAQNCTLFAGAFHGQEWLTCSLLTLFTENLAYAYTNRQMLLDTDIRAVLSQKGLVCVPMVNPDGVEIALNGPKSAYSLRHFVEALQQKNPKKWQANARGVDLNHNYDAGFSELQKIEQRNGIFDPSPTQYGGKRPHSEPETQAMVNLCYSLPFQKAFAFHSQGEEIFYEYGSHTPMASKPIAELLADTCGYTLVQNTGLASHGGFKDWFIDKMHRPGFTIEIGKGENPLPIEDLQPIYARLLEMMLLAVMI